MKKRELNRWVAEWLKSFLERCYPYADSIIVQELGSLTIANFLKRHGLLESQAGSVAFDIKTDVIGAVILPMNEVRLAIVEVEMNPVNLSSLCRTLGLSQILRPSHVFMISPQGWSSSLHQLVRDFHRVDVLEYAKDQHIIVAKWDLASASIRPGEVLTHGRTILSM